MANNSKPINELVGKRVQHDYSAGYIGKIVKARADIRGYNYYVEWENAPERNDWYSLSALIIKKEVSDDK